MARICKPGLDYFPLDVNFFQDRKVRRISNRHHAAGIAALTSLLCLIYKEKGFYVAWNQDTLFDISQEVCCEEEEMQAIIDDYITTAMPVGSRTISRKEGMGLSSATIRNEMADLHDALGDKLAAEVGVPEGFKDAPRGPRGPRGDRGPAMDCPRGDGPRGDAGYYDGPHRGHY